MAGPSLGAHAPAQPTQVFTTRTRRQHGAVAANDGVLLTVSTSRRAGDWPGVTLQAGDVSEPDLYFADCLRPDAARALARALLAGAEAIDNAQRVPHFDRTGGAA